MDVKEIGCRGVYCSKVVQNGVLWRILRTERNLLTWSIIPINFTRKTLGHGVSLD
jgi:hypothetical protein